MLPFSDRVPIASISPSRLMNGDETSELPVALLLMTGGLRFSGIPIYECRRGRYESSRFGMTLKRRVRKGFWQPLLANLVSCGAKAV